MKAIRVVVSDDGSTEITTTGFKGKACTLCTESLEKALGTVRKDTKTPEYHQEEVNRQRV